MEKYNIEFIDSLRKGLASEDFNERESSNLALLAYDIGRAKNIEERKNASEQWTFRMHAFTCQNGLKEAMKLMKNY